MTFKSFLHLFLISLFWQVGWKNSNAQTAVVFGRLTDSIQNPIESANIAVPGTPFGTTSDKDGFFSLTVPANQNLRISASILGYSVKSFDIKLTEGEKYKLNVTLEAKPNLLNGVQVEDKGERGGGMKTLDVKNAGIIPTPGGSLESLIKTLPGVSSNNEMSSQYNVRGGNTMKIWFTSMMWRFIGLFWCVPVSKKD